jgi:hypothetical protein
MNDQARWYEQGNQGERVIANQGGPQYNNNGGYQFGQNGGTQHNNFGGQQHNGSGHQFNGGRNFVNTGSGSINIQQQMRNLFDGGIKALAHRQYAEVVAVFRELLSTAESAHGFSDAEDRERGARAHAYIAIGLLNGSRPSYHSSEVIREIEGHLAQAREQGDGTFARPLADVVLAIVKEDFYDERQIPTGPPSAWELRASLAALAPTDLEDLALHLVPAEGQTWREMTTLATASGYRAHKVAGEEAPRVIAPDRRVKVIKYFTRTPDPVSPVWHRMFFGGAALLVILAVVAGDLFSLLLVVAAAWAAKKGYDRYQVYRRYLREYAAAEPKPDEAELDKWLKEDTREITRRGARKLQVRLDDDLAQSDLITPPIVVVGFPDRRLTRNGWLSMKIGRDRGLRADHYSVLVLFLTRQVVSTYRCVLEFATGELLATQETRQHHWSNITGVSSVSVPASLQEDDLANLHLVGEGGELDISLRHQFTVSIMSSEPLRVTTGFGGQSFATSGGGIAWQGNDHALTIIQGEVRARNAR